jgi:chromosome transmission fidelity protein 1
VLLDAAARFERVVDESRAVILVGGTLAPIPELARKLFPTAVTVPTTPDEEASRASLAPPPSTASAYAAAPVPSLAAAAIPGFALAAAAAVAAAANPVQTTTPVGRTLTTLSCGHVVPRDALLPIAVGAGPSGRAFDFSFSARAAPEMIDELGRLLVNACAVAPGRRGLQSCPLYMSLQLSC